jgi:hypothetical protein
VSRLAHILRLDEGPPYLNFPTHMRSWAGVMLEKDNEKNCLHGLYLKLQLTLHVLRTNVSCVSF